MKVIMEEAGRPETEQKIRQTNEGATATRPLGHQRLYCRVKSCRTQDAIAHVTHKHLMSGTPVTKQEKITSPIAKRTFHKRGYANQHGKMLSLTCHQENTMVAVGDLSTSSTRIPLGRNRGLAPGAHAGAVCSWDMSRDLAEQSSIS